MKRNKKRELSRTERLQPEALAKELEGYCNAGMKEEALRIADAILKKKRITPEEFFQLIRTVGVHSNFTKWETKIRAAYDRQSRRSKQKARSDMLLMYASNGEWQEASNFLSLRRPCTAAEILFSMDVLLALKRFDDARRLGMRCIKIVTRPIDAFNRSLLITAIGEYFSRMQMWEEAVDIWKYMPLDQPFRRDALTGIVRACLGRALESAERGLQSLSDLKRNPNYELHISLPYNDQKMSAEAERELLKLKRGIEKLLPEETRRDVGVMTGEELLRPDSRGESDDTPADR